MKIKGDLKLELTCHWKIFFVNGNYLNHFVSIRRAAKCTFGNIFLSHLKFVVGF